MTKAIRSASSLLGEITSRAAQHPAHVVLCESHDTRVLHAASRALRDQVAHITLIGHEPDIRHRARQEGLGLDGARFIDPTVSPFRSEFRSMLQTLRPWRRMKPDRLKRSVVHPLHFSNLLVRAGYADGSVAGAVYSSSEVMRSATRIIGKAADSAVLSSFFLMYFNCSHHPVQGGMIFADCAL